MDRNLLFLLLFALPTLLAAQKRYFDPIFPNLNVTNEVTYGQNWTIFQLNAGPPHPSYQTLKMDVYEPAGDTAAARPLVVLLHGGLFLPPNQNGSCKGTKQDGEIVELAKRLAKMGYVVAAMDYRLGWNPLASIELARRFTFVNAVHRGVQDSRTCVRFFKKNQNQFRIDPEKITLWGTETGSYIVLASATLDDMGDWDKEKFQINPVFPMVQDTFNGNLDGTSVGVVSEIYHQITSYSVGDTLCTPNHLGYSSDFALAVNMSDGLLDTAWLQNDNIPLLSFASPSVVFGGPVLTDPCGMYYFGFWGFPFPSPILGEIAGSCAIQARQAQLGNNAVWQNAQFSDLLSVHSLGINDNHEGFYPFWGTAELTPWAFSTMPAPPNLACDTNATEAKIYLDTVLAYFAPRACAVLGLDADCNRSVGTQTPVSQHFSLKISPNPATSQILVRAVEPIFSLEIFDLQGKNFCSHTGLNDLEIQVQKENLPPGIYLVKARLANRIAWGKVIWQ